MARTWQHRRCDRCRTEYLPTREAQSYCSPRCKRDAEYGRTRSERGIRGPRRRQLRPQGISINSTFSSTETAPCKPTKSLISLPIDLLGRGHRWPRAIRLDRELRERILWCEIGER